MGDARLLQRAEPVSRFDTPELHALLADMRDTMHSLDGAGLAAPQIGIGLRVVIFGVEKNPRYPDAEEVPQTVLINPVITPLGGEVEEGWACPACAAWCRAMRRCATRDGMNTANR